MPIILAGPPIKTVWPDFRNDIFFRQDEQDEQDKTVP